MSTGWRCPACSACYAPFVTECRRCNAPVTTGAGTDPIAVGGVEIVLSPGCTYDEVVRRALGSVPPKDAA